jgi:hypothetical protein
MVVVVCEPIAELHRQDQLREAAQRMRVLFSAEPVTSRPDPEWRHFWSTLAID